MQAERVERPVRLLLANLIDKNLAQLVRNLLCFAVDQD